MRKITFILLVFLFAFTKKEHHVNDINETISVVLNFEEQDPHLDYVVLNFYSKQKYSRNLIVFDMEVHTKYEELEAYRNIGLIMPSSKHEKTTYDPVVITTEEAESVEMGCFKVLSDGKCYKTIRPSTEGVYTIKELSFSLSNNALEDPYEVLEKESVLKFYLATSYGEIKSKIKNSDELKNKIPNIIKKFR
ncbi:hypothetical protein WAF17_09375 [Bernardetia sp. ABR2-2B]|uniref:hypothetical protein n=1 Tax=Bernardetia sp. ABR2-2B TaxID=3127472 RepID=UPI0030D091D6